MKLVAICLLLLNVAYFSWHYMKDDAGVDRVVENGRELGNIKLLSEVTDDDKVLAMIEVVDNPVVEAPASQETAECTGIGPFVDVFTGQNALEQINALDVVATLKAVDVLTGEKDYRVLISPASSPEEAFRKLRELQASDVDSYVITQGEYALGISLGVFSSESGAEVLQGRVSSIGYASEIIEIERQSRSYWIEVSPEEFQRLQAANWLENSPDLTNRPMICTES
jgi:hypothetical protein